MNILIFYKINKFNIKIKTIKSVKEIDYKNK